jgi:hypothetical protein
LEVPKNRRNLGSTKNGGNLGNTRKSAKFLPSINPTKKVIILVRSETRKIRANDQKKVN